MKNWLYYFFNRFFMHAYTHIYIVSNWLIWTNYVIIMTLSLSLCISLIYLLISSISKDNELSVIRRSVHRRTSPCQPLSTIIFYSTPCDSVVNYKLIVKLMETNVRHHDQYYQSESSCKTATKPSPPQRAPPVTPILSLSSPSYKHIASS